MRRYTDEEMLMLSGIQHFMFCPRQWALIHIEQLWSENALTAEGHILHENVDNPKYRRLNNGTLTLRGINLVSRELGLSGTADAIECTPAQTDDNGVALPGYRGKWLVMPVEYKRGKVKPTEMDEVQLTAQVMCLEEMFSISISRGALFYFQERHRHYIDISDELRKLTRYLASEMHVLLENGMTPPPEKKAHCRNCSLIDHCMPGMETLRKASNYLKSNLYEATS